MNQLLFGAFALVVSMASAFAQPFGCSVKDQRVCSVFERVQRVVPTRQIVWREGSTTHPSVAAEFEWALGAADVIHLGHTRDLDDDALFFLVAHELGHSFHGHGREFVAFFATEADKALPDLALVQKYAAHAMANVHQAGPLKHRQEFEADAFAVRVMLAYGLDPLSAMRGLLKGQFASVVHPSRRARLDNAAALIATTNVSKVAARD